MESLRAPNHCARTIAPRLPKLRTLPTLPLPTLRSNNAGRRSVSTRFQSCRSIYTERNRTTPCLHVYREIHTNRRDTTPKARAHVYPNGATTCQNHNRNMSKGGQDLEPPDQECFHANATTTYRHGEIYTDRHGTPAPNHVGCNTDRASTP